MEAIISAISETIFTIIIMVVAFKYVLRKDS